MKAPELTRDPLVEGIQGLSGTRVLLVDDHEVVRRGVSLLLSTALGCVVVEASDAQRGLRSLGSWQPDVVITDCRMPDHDGLWLLEQIKQASPDVPVLMLSTFDTPDYVEGALSRGASGYLLKDASVAELGDAIRCARAGKGVSLSPAVARRLLERRRMEQESGALTVRERETLDRLVTGESNAEIAAALFLSEKTVKSHLSRIFRKLGVTTRAEAIAHVNRRGDVHRDRPAP